MSTFGCVLDPVQLPLSKKSSLRSSQSTIGFQPFRSDATPGNSGSQRRHSGETGFRAAATARDDRFNPLEGQPLKNISVSSRQAELIAAPRSADRCDSSDFTGDRTALRSSASIKPRPRSAGPRSSKVHVCSKDREPMDSYQRKRQQQQLSALFREDSKTGEGVAHAPGSSTPSTVLETASTASTQCAGCSEWRRQEEQDELRKLRKEVKELEKELENKDFTVETIQRNLQNVCRLMASDRQELLLLRRRDGVSEVTKLRRELRENEEQRFQLEDEVEKLRQNNLLLQQKVCKLREGGPPTQ